jgi:nicotinamide mononucleotide transporter
MLLDHGFTVFGEFVSYAEFAGQLLALAVVVLAGRRTLWTWPTQLISVALLFAVYTAAHLGGLAARQVFVGSIAVYGWQAWVRRRDPVFGVTVRRATRRELTAFAAGAAAAIPLFSWLLIATHGSWAPWPDSAIFIGTVAAFTMQAIGLVEFWPAWLAVDAVGVPVQLSSGLWFSAAVYTVFAVLVVRGWYRWSRTARGARSVEHFDRIADRDGA